MSYTNVYPSRINWENEPSIASPINATNLNKIDFAAYQFDQTFETWDVTKANQSDLLLSVKSIDYDTTTGVFVFTWQNGTTKTVDLNIEKIPVSFSMSAQGVITMTTEDGTQYTADVGSLIKTYTFTDSTEIDFTVTTDASGNKTVTAALKDGSIVGSKLEPNYLANCQSAANSASASKTAAEGSAEDSEAWAVGTRDGVPVQSTDPAYNNNAKYWAEHTTSSFAGLTDTSITNPQNGQVPVYNSSTNKWENADQSAGGGSTIKITTSESALYGRTVTITCGTYTESSTFSNSGEAEFTGVTATGTFTITTSTSGGTSVSKSLSVPYFGNYSTTITLFSATITATFPASNGATCVCDGVTATTSPYTFTVGATGTYTATCTLDGVSKTQSFTITTDGQTETHTFEYGTINLTFDNEFRGLTLTCTDSSYTITKTAPSTGNTMVFYPNETNTWTISGTYSGVTYTTTATVSSLSTPVSAILQTIPDGSTVTPTDSIQTWLKCAAINDKSYTTLNEVLADTDTFTALLQDSNACDYMARSTTWASTICADADAMARIGKYDYCSNALLGNSTWLNAIASSSYAESIFDISVPKMTSNTTPSGVASAISEYPTPTRYAWYAFNGTIATNPDYIWYPNSQATSDIWIQYKFTSAVCITAFKIKIGTPSNPNTTSSFKLQGSNDGTTFTDITSVYTTTSSDELVYSFENSNSYQYYRLYFTDSHISGGQYNGAVNELQFYGRHEAQTNIIHSAASDTLYYIDGTSQTIGTTDTSGVGTVNWSNVPVGNLTIYSSVAHEPDDLTSAYSKTVRITPNTVEVYVMPDNSSYWYGYNADNIELTSSENGYTVSTGSASFNGTLTKNTNNVYLATSSGGNLYAIADKTARTGKTTAILQGVGSDLGESGYGRLGNITNKSVNYSSLANISNIKAITTNTLQKFQLANSVTDYNTVVWMYGGQAVNIYALWYE